MGARCVTGGGVRSIFLMLSGSIIFHI